RRAALELVRRQGAYHLAEVGLADLRRELVARCVRSGGGGRGGTGVGIGRGAVAAAGGQRQRGGQGGRQEESLHAEVLRGAKPLILAAFNRAVVPRAPALRTPCAAGCQSFGARAVEKGIGVAPLMAPVVAVSWTYSLTSWSNCIVPPTTASGPITIRGMRLVPKRIQLPPEDLRTRRSPCTCEPMPTVMSPETVSTLPVTSVPTRPMPPLTVLTSPSTRPPRSMKMLPLTESTSSLARRPGPASLLPLTVAIDSTWACSPSRLRPLTVVSSPPWIRLPARMPPLTVVASLKTAPSPMRMPPLTVLRSPACSPAATSMPPLTRLMSSAATAGVAASARAKKSGKGNARRSMAKLLCGLVRQQHAPAPLQSHLPLFTG